MGSQRVRHDLATKQQIIQVGPKSNDKHLDESHSGERHMELKGHMKAKKEIWLELVIHKPRKAWHYQKRDDARRILPESFQKACSPACALMLVFWLPELGGKTFLLFQVTQCMEICYSSPKNLIWYIRRDTSLVIRHTEVKTSCKTLYTNSTGKN